MDFELTEVQKQILREVDRVTASITAEERRAMDESDIFNESVYSKLANSKLLSAPFAKQYGGSDLSLLEVVLIAERLTCFSYTLANMYLVPVIFAGMLVQHCGSEKQKATLLPGLIKGELRFSFSLTERGAGSDAQAMHTRAESTESGFLLNGEKYWGTGAAVADYILTVARTGIADEGWSIFIVPNPSPGLSVVPIPKLAGSSYASCEVHYKNVEVPKAALLGMDNGYNRALKQLAYSADLERIGVAACTIGLGEAIKRACISHAKQRIQFKQPVIEFQAVRHMLANIATDLEAMRFMTYHAAWLKAKGKRAFKEASMAKLFCSEQIVDIAKRGMQIFGGRAYALDCPMQRYLREAYLALYAGGTSEIQRNLIGRFL